MNLRKEAKTFINHKYMKDAFNEYRKNLIENHHVSEEEISDFDQFMGMLRGDIPTPAVCDMDLEIRERKRIFEQFVRGLKEN